MISVNNDLIQSHFKHYVFATIFIFSLSSPFSISFSKADGIRHRSGRVNSQLQSGRLPRSKNPDSLLFDLNDSKLSNKNDALSNSSTNEELLNIDSSDMLKTGNCENVNFNIVTGKVFTAPKDILETIPGTLMITDCIDFCRRNSSCFSANFETGLCVLFESSASQISDGLVKSQFPVFTIYIEKTCLPPSLQHVMKKCDSSWAFENVNLFDPNREDLLLSRKYIRKHGPSQSLTHCQALCLAETEFVCRSATYSIENGDCRLSEMNRHTVDNGVVQSSNQRNGGVSSKNQFLNVKSGGDESSEEEDPIVSIYMESNCIEEPVKLCDFRLSKHRIMKTVDSVYQDVPSLEACRDLCLTAPFRCHSIDYGDTGDRVCRLSHHSSSTLNHIEEPFLEIRDVTGTYELSNCYKVNIECKSSEMVVNVVTNKVFDGKIYAKNNPNSCVEDVENQIEFAITMKYNDLQCDVKQRKAGVYTNEMIIQHHDSIVTSTDLGLSLNCQYDLSNKTVTNDVNLAIEGKIEPSMFEEVVVDSPNVLMKITTEKDDAETIKSARVGDPLYVRFAIVDQESPYEIFVRDLIAKDGNDQNEIVLIDSKGCPASQVSTIIGPLRKDFESESGKDLVAKFDAFKFPTSDVVQFRAHVTPCMPYCEPVICDVRDSSGSNNLDGLVTDDIDDFYSPFTSPDVPFDNDPPKVKTALRSLGKRSVTPESFSFRSGRAFMSKQYYDIDAERASQIRENTDTNEKDLLVTQAFLVLDKFDEKTNALRKKSVIPDSTRRGLTTTVQHDHNMMDRTEKPHTALLDRRHHNEKSQIYVHQLPLTRDQFEKIYVNPDKKGQRSAHDDMCFNTTSMSVALLFIILLQVVIGFVINFCLVKRRGNFTNCQKFGETDSIYSYNSNKSNVSCNSNHFPSPSPQYMKHPQPQHTTPPHPPFLVYGHHPSNSNTISSNLGGGKLPFPPKNR